MYDYIKKILENVGPRAPGSEDERKAAEIVKKDLLDLSPPSLDLTNPVGSNR